MKFSINKSSSSVGSATAVQFISKFVNVFFQLGVTMVLARLLTPEEYGTVAVLTVFIGFFSILSDIGISSAIIQFQDLNERDYEHLYFFSMLVGIILSGVFFALSFGIAYFFQNSAYVSLGATLTPAILFNSLNMVPNGVLLKQKKFILVSFRLVTSTVIVGFATILLAYLGFGCYAIVLNAVFTSLFIYVWNAVSTKLRPRFGDFRPVLRKVGTYSAFQFGHQAIGWFSSNLDSLLVGKLFGAGALGYYNKAYTLSGYPNTLLVSSITSTLRPFLAEHQNDMEVMNSRFCEIAKTLSLIVAIAAVEMSVCAPELILIMFGQTWMEAAPLLQILAFSVYTRGMAAAYAPLMGASNRTDLLMLSTGVNALISCLMIAVGGLLGSVTSLTIFVTLSYLLGMIAPVVLGVRYCLKKSIVKHVIQFLPELGAAIIACALCMVIPWDIANVFLSLLAKAVVCAFFYFSICMLLGQKSNLQKLILFFKKR